MGRAALALGALLLFSLIDGCAQGQAGKQRGLPAETVNQPAQQWYVFQEGRLAPSTFPAGSATAFLPWTVQTRVAGFLQIDHNLAVAVNGWGLLVAQNPYADRLDFASFEDRSLLGGRSINGLYANGDQILLHLYYNTLFDTPVPSSPAVALVTFDLASNYLRPSMLPLTKSGWETADVVHRADGRWSIAWKRTSESRVDFRYTFYSPATGLEQFVTRNAFLASYDFHEMAGAPHPIKAMDEQLRAVYGKDVVIHYQVKTPGYAWVTYYQSGPEQRLLAGDASLVSIPVFRSLSTYYALVPDGSILVDDSSETGAPASIGLPSLPGGFAYTDFWTDGVTLVVSWEQQRFPDIGSAGLYVRTIAPNIGVATPGT